MLIEHPQGTEAIPDRLLGVLGLGVGLVKLLARQGDPHGGSSVVILGLGVRRACVQKARLGQNWFTKEAGDSTQHL